MTLFDDMFERFGPDVAPFMHRMRAEMAEGRPLEGLRLVHNVPLTMTTLLKLDCLRAGGADLLVSNYSYCTPDALALRALEEAGIPFAPVDKVFGDFDVVMDCGAELMDRCSARLGAVELTRTGAVAYERAAPSYPVVSVDNARLKQLETCLGTGEGIFRGIRNLTGRDFHGCKMVLFGFGKVGRGIAHCFAGADAHVSVVEMLPDRLQAALDKGYNAVPGSHKAEVEELVEAADLIVTATGRKNVISDFYDTEAFKAGATLANAGAEDEYGPDFGPEEVLFDKGPVNFSQAEPTQMRFLDPIFYAHNMALLDLLAKPAPGFYALSRDTDDEVMADWCRFHGWTESELEAIFGP